MPASPAPSGAAVAVAASGALGAAALAGVWRLLRWRVLAVPTAPAVRQLALQVMAELPREGHIVDLGAGLGSMARPLARRFPAARVVGVEGSGLVWLIGRLLPRAPPNLTWRRGDLLACDLRGVAGVYCYLYRGIMPALAAKLRAELPAGAWVVSHTFALPGWTPRAVHRAPDLYRTLLHVYRVPGAPGDPPAPAGRPPGVPAASRP